MRATSSAGAIALRPILVRWPSEADHRVRAAAEGRPCLLVVDAGAELPVPGELEDWVAHGTSEIDVAARLDGLEAFARSRPTGPRVVLAVPADLSPGDRRMAQLLLRAVGFVVTRAQLADEAGWDADLDEAVARVRSSLEGANWRIERVAEQGFVAVIEDEP